MENVPSGNNDELTRIQPSSHWINIGGAALLAEVHGREHEAEMFRRSAGYTDDGDFFPPHGQNGVYYNYPNN
jgi:hypothetical protein